MRAQPFSMSCSDGAELADEALALDEAGMPFLAFNSLRTESEQSEHKGLLNLMKEVQIVEESAK